MKATYSATLLGVSPEVQGDILRDWMALVGRDLVIVGSSNGHRGEGEVSLAVGTGDREREDWDAYVWQALDLAVSRPGRDGSSVADRQKATSD